MQRASPLSLEDWLVTSEISFGLTTSCSYSLFFLLIWCLHSKQPSGLVINICRLREEGCLLTDVAYAGRTKWLNEALLANIDYLLFLTFHPWKKKIYSLPHPSVHCLQLLWFLCWLLCWLGNKAPSQGSKWPASELGYLYGVMLLQTLILQGFWEVVVYFCSLLPDNIIEFRTVNL